jgi:hypothetical protein
MFHTVQLIPKNDGAWACCEVCSWRFFSLFGPRVIRAAEDHSRIAAPALLPV